MIDNYKKLSIRKYIELQEMELEGREEIDVQVNILSILNDMTEDEICDLPLDEYKKLVVASSFLKTPPVPNDKIADTITINKTKYNVIKNIKKLTAGQYIDYQNYIKNKDLKMLPYILSVFIIPDGKKYGDNLENTIEDIYNLSIIDALSLSAFFLRKWESLTKATLIYLIWKMKWMMKKEKNPMVKEQMKIATQKLTMLRNTIKDGVGLVGLLK